MHDYMKTIISALKLWVNEKIDNSVADWNQNDKNAPNYVKNKPFGDESTYEELLAEQTMSITGLLGDHAVTQFPMTSQIVSGERYVIYFNGETYNCIAKDMPEMSGLIAIGNAGLSGAYGMEDTGEPFCFTCLSETGWLVGVRDAGDYTISIQHVIETVKTIDPKYLPEGIGGGADWSQNDPNGEGYIKNRPFYDTRSVVDTTITFDGNLEGKEVVADGTYHFVKVSDKIINSSELVGETMSTFIEGNTTSGEITADMIYADYPLDVIGNCIYICYEEIAMNDAVTLTPGIWFMCINVDGTYVVYVSSMSYKSLEGELKTIDPKYIKDMYYEEQPKAELFYENSEIDFTNANPIYDLGIPMLTVGASYVVTWDGETYNCIARDDGYNEIYIGNQSCSPGWGFPETIESDEPFFIATWDNGNSNMISVESLEIHSISISAISGEAIIHKIDPKYLPDGIGGGADWDQNDPDGAGYIKNKPFYGEGEKVVGSIFKGELSAFGDNLVAQQVPLIEGEKYTLIIDGFTYPDLIAQLYGYGNENMLGISYSFYDADTNKSDQIILFKVMPGYTTDSGTVLSIYNWDSNPDFEWGVNDHYYSVEVIGPKKGSVIKQMSGKFITDGYYEENTDTILIQGTSMYSHSSYVGFSTEEQYCVEFDGITYGPYTPIVVADGVESGWENYWAYFGNGKLFKDKHSQYITADSFPDTGEPFCIEGTQTSRPYEGVIGQAYGVNSPIFSSDVDIDSDAPNTFVLKRINKPIIHKIDKKYIPEPFSSLLNEKNVPIIDETEFVLSDIGNNIFDVYDDSYNGGIQSGFQYVVVFNGTKYNCVAYELDGAIALGNANIIGKGVDTGEPFLIGAFASGIDICTKGISSVTISISGAVHKIDKKYLPSYSIFDGIILKDSINGHEYIGEMQNGTFVTYCKCDHIEVAQMPTKIEYWVGDTFDPSGMVITAVGTDGSTRVVEKYSYTQSIEERMNSIEIQYVECDVVYTVNVPITVFSLIDFEYIENEDGTYTLTGWKGTRNGNPAYGTLEVPNSSLIRIELEG